MLIKSGVATLEYARDLFAIELEGGESDGEIGGDCDNAHDEEDFEPDDCRFARLLSQLSV